MAGVEAKVAMANAAKASLFVYPGCFVLFGAP
jgi:hypothetical protein